MQALLHETATWEKKNALKVTLRVKYQQSLAKIKNKQIHQVLSMDFPGLESKAMLNPGFCVTRFSAT